MSNLDIIRFHRHSKCLKFIEQVFNLEMCACRYEIYIGTANEENPATGKNETISVLPDKIDLKLGGSYIVAIVKNGTDSYKIHVSEVVSPNSMHMFWLLPQYIIMTAGEVMFSVTIMDFSYSQVIYSGVNLLF